jgi:hypothetical protein
MGDPSAILAINSLDRYTSTLIETDTYLQGRWGLIEPFKISIASGVPIVGATLEFTTGIGFPVPPPGEQVRVLTVTPFPGNLYQITINYPVTQNQINNALIYQLITFAAANQPVSNALVAQYNDLGPYSNNFTIQSPGALIYGYINRIVVSQIQLSYNIPTINRNLNDTFYIYTAEGDLVPIVIPHGYYYADELAATMQTLIRANAILAPFTMTVTFAPRDGFVFTSTSSPPREFCFPSPALLRGEAQLTSAQLTNVLKTYRLLGMSFGANAEFNIATSQTSFEYPNFLYTPYIDFYSDVLTNYQNIKDTNTSVKKPKGLIARVYVSGTGQIQTTGSVTALGTAPFVMTSDLNTPKIIRWSPDVAVPSIDFQLLDQYGEEIPGALEGFSTEFQITLLCIEGRD